MVWHVVNVTLGLLFAGVFVLVDPLNLDDGIARRGRDLFYGVMGFGYPDGGPKTAVVLLNDDFLIAQGLPWPAPYATHAGVLEEIAAHKPAAILMDMVIVDARRDDLEPLLETLARISVTTPIYIGADPVSEGQAGARPEVMRLVRTHPGVRLVTLRRGAPLGSGFAYPLEPVEGRRPAAVALYEDLVAKSRLQPRRKQDQMDIWWAAPRDDFNCRGAATEHACSMIGQSMAGRIATLAFATIVPIFPDQTRLTEVDVPRAPTLDVAGLVNGDAAVQVDGALRHAVVFYGQNLSFLGDRERTPLQSEAPGVHAHAMAYDNLVTLKGRYISAGAPWGLPEKAHTLLVLALMAIVTLLARLGASAWRPALRLQPHLRGGRFGLIDSLIIPAVALLVALYEFKVLAVGPSVWATVLVAAITGDLLATRSFAGAAVVRLLKRRKTAAMAVRQKPRWRR